MGLFDTSSGEQALTIVIKARNEAEAALKRAGDAVTKFGKDNKDMLKGVAAAGAIAGAAFVAMGKYALDAAAEGEAQMARFNTVMENSVGASDAVREAILKQAEATKQLGFDDEDAALSIGLFFQRTQDLNTALQLNAIAMDVAAFKNVGLADAGKLVSLVLSGNARALKEYGIELDETKSPMEALIELQGKVGGSAQSMSETFQGQMKSFRIAVDDTFKALGNQLLPILTELVKKITPVVFAVANWMSEHKKLTAIIAGSVGGIIAIVTALASLALVFPKVVAGAKLVASTFTPVGVVVIALTAAIGLITAKFLVFAEEVGGAGRAFNMTVLSMKEEFWKLVKTVLEGINVVTQYIPFIGSSIQGAIDSVNTNIAEAQNAFSSLANDGINNVTDKAQELGAIAPGAFKSLSKAASESADQVKEANKAIEETQTRIKELQLGHIRELTGANEDYARAYVQQEQKVADIRRDIQNSSDAEQISSLSAQLQQEESALTRHRDIQVQLAQYVAEEKRRISLTDFEREIEDIASRVNEQNLAFQKKMMQLQLELSENQKKRDKVIAMEKEVTAAVTTESKARTQSVVADNNTQISSYNALAEAAARASSSKFVATSSFGGTALSTPAFLPKREFGGLINAPEGKPVPIIAHGGERVIPARAAAASVATNGINVVFNNTQVRSDDDIVQIQRMVESFFRSLIINRKVAV